MPKWLLLVVPVLASVVASCSSTPPTSRSAITVSVPDSLAGPIRSVAHAYMAAGDGTIRLEVWDGSKTDASLRSSASIPDVVLADGVAVDVHLQTPVSHPVVSWFATFATSPLVVAFKASSATSKVTATTWYALMAKPGIGHLDPTQDPEGSAATTAIQAAAQWNHDPTDLRLLSEPSDEGPGSALIARVKGGTLFGAMVYENQAKTAGLLSAPIKSLLTNANYTVTIPTGSKQRSGATQFIEFLLSSTGRALLEKSGLTVTPHPTVAGNAGTIPTPLKSDLGQE
jgi:molybdate/tungstate transport system substrate-binding protein